MCCAVRCFALSTWQGGQGVARLELLPNPSVGRTLALITLVKVDINFLKSPQNDAAMRPC